MKETELSVSTAPETTATSSTQGSGPTSVKLTDRDSVDLMFKRILQSDYEWEEKSVKVHLLELDKDSRNLTDQSNFTKLCDNLDCVVVFLDASSPGNAE